MTDVPPDPAETDRLLRQARAGDRRAFDELFARHRDYLGRVVELRLDGRVRARLDPSDVVQEAHLEAWRRLAAYLERPGLPFRLWLRQIAQDQAAKARRRHLGTARRTAEREVPFPERSSLLLARKLFGGESGPGAGLDREELARQIQRAMAQLPEADREVLVLRDYEGLSNPEVGLLLGLDPAAVSKRHGRALLRLHKLLFDGGLTESPL
jgi:RNA polymerase sigma-70 factor (ECF subfamily)